MQANPSLDVTAVIGQQFLDFIGFFDAIIDVDAENHVLVLRHALLLLSTG
jgi:hypothetical protein